jgi:hypothetical protein
MASEFVEGEDIKMDEAAEVGVLGTAVTRFIIFLTASYAQGLAEFQTCFSIWPGFPNADG